MSYIGKNPEADSVKLKGSATEPSGTAVDGQVYFNTGAGSISKGMKVYKNSQFVAIDKQLGDADTMQLLKAADIPAIDFNLSYTSTTVGGQGAVPFESSTGDFDGTAAFTNSSTGDALLTDDSADLVFHYTTQATNSADNDFWGIPLTVPRAFRGGNLVLEFKYRTEIASGTMDDGYFNIAVQDRSAMILQTQASTISAGAIAAGANVLLTGKTYANPVTSTTLTVAVGDRVFVESGTGTVGDQANDIVDCYITSVSSTDNNVTLSKDIVAVQSGKFVTGWLTGYDTGGQISAFASDTNKDGTSKKIAFKTDADTQQVSLWFFVKGTSTVKHELFFDNVLLSGNKFLQASSQTKSEAYYVYSQADVWDATGTGPFYEWDVSLIDPGPDTPPLADSKLLSMGDITGPGTIGTVTAITAKQDITIYVTFTSYANNGGEFFIENSSAQHLAASYAPNSAAAGYENVAASINLAKDDYIYFKTYKTGARDGMISVTATPQTSPVILLENQDEIFTEWVDFTPTGSWTSNTTYSGKWRRVGGNMELQYHVKTTGAPNSVTLRVNLPSGYTIDTNRMFAPTADGADAGAGPHLGVASYFDGPTGTVDYGGRIGFYSSTSLEFSVDQVNATYTLTTPANQAEPFTWATGDVAYAKVSVPISGWNANFNPLLSMPLVEIGGNSESYIINDWTGVAGFSLYSTETPLVDTISDLGTIYNSSTTGFYFVASQRVRANLSFFTMSTGQPDIGVAAGPSTVDFYGTSILAADKHQYRLAVKSMPANSIEGCAGEAILNPGERIGLGRASSTDSVDTSSYGGGAALTVEKDFSNTNMAHIIKPAVANLSAVYAYNDQEGVSSNTTGSFVPRELNTVSGESWFVTLSGTGTTGVGGTNTDFTLDPGTYELKIRMPFYLTGYAYARLYDVTNSAVVSGSTAVANWYFKEDTGIENAGHMEMNHTMTITSATKYRLQSRITFDTGSWAYGPNSNLSTQVSNGNNVVIKKLK
jgi:hypothetical protein